jgi:hypothetical protein
LCRMGLGVNCYRRYSSAGIGYILEGDSNA